MSQVKRVYVEKKTDYAVKAKELLAEIKAYLAIEKIENVRQLIRYDIENVSEDTYNMAKDTVFSEPPVDYLYEEEFPLNEKETVFSVEFLPGQFDQRADSAEQCLKLLNEKEEPAIRSAITYVLEGDLSEEEIEKIKAYCINPVDSRQSAESKPETLITEFEEPADVAIFDGFSVMPEEELKDLYDSLGLAMTFKDFLHIQNYFAGEEKRDPSMTEIRVLDTYWSDHCRHTTFSTELKNVEFEDGYYKEVLENTYKEYLADREELYKGRKDKFVCLMDLALIAMKKIKADGGLDDMEVSDEINACSIVVPVTIDGETEEWLISFKNETHNHPTEIEPFGGAATCLGGAIRDPLSGRSYVYQAMRVTGAADPTLPLDWTLNGKLPQRKLTTGAADGYSSYGNQIGLATGMVDEIYHPNYVAKRLEIGAVMGAAPRKNVVRETSDPGDIIILLGGRTGRDGCGGATGSSKVHTEQSLETCGAEVQKGNPPTERKIQRLFRREEVSKLIKKCNDFGAGGVSVAIGELADGLQIDLDRVPKKYAGLDGTELAISESQERMAVVVDKNDVETFLAYAKEENLEAVEVAVVTEEKRLVMHWRGKTIVDLSRAFLDTNGAHQETDVFVKMPEKREGYEVKDIAAITLEDIWTNCMKDLNVCSKKGLVEMFDSSIGAGTVLMPYGGKNQATPIQTMIAKLPILKGESNTVTMMSYGFDPHISSWSPYHGAIYAVIESMAKIVASGGDYKKIRFTFQEYFKRLGEDKERWGEPFAALLGAYSVQKAFGLPSIGGKDSMSGTFNDIDVPPTLVSFAVDIGDVNEVITPELKKSDNHIVLIEIPFDEHRIPDYDQAKRAYRNIYKMARNNQIESAYAVGKGGIIGALSKMAFGNGLGVRLDSDITLEKFTEKCYGSILLEVSSRNIRNIGMPCTYIGEVIEEKKIVYKDEEFDLGKMEEIWDSQLETVFPTDSGIAKEVLDTPVYDAAGKIYIAKHKVAVPKVFIPVFPGTNCEYDTTKAFELAGANVSTRVFRNLTEQDIRDSIEEFEKEISDSQIIMFPGGFSAGDEPEGSAKFFATVFRNEKMKEAIHKLLDERDGLALGICNGFQALIKLGLLPYGEITKQQPDSPTLTMNSIGRHISKMVHTKIVSNKSPWLKNAILRQSYVIPASHGEGRFVASDEWIEKLFKNGQVATQYVDLNGNPTMDEKFNPNGSYAAIEGITSPDGRILGKMAHSERIGLHVAKNIPGNQNQHIFEAGVDYFK